jgi:hypothetical protein
MDACEEGTKTVTVISTVVHKTEGYILIMLILNYKKAFSIH